jgi:dienelactone hydrolase
MPMPVTYAAHIYDGANHGFHNDTTPRYKEAAAKLARQRPLKSAARPTSLCYLHESFAHF